MIRKLQLHRISLITLVFFMVLLFAPVKAQAADLIPCDPNEGSGSFLGLPHWYEFIKDGTQDPYSHKCIPQLKCGSSADATCDAKSGIDPSKISLIALAILELLLRLGGLVTVAMVVFGGFKYITSQGQPDATKNARATIINAFVGLVITIVAAVSVNFIAKLLQ